MIVARFLLAFLLAEAAGLGVLTRLGRERRSGPGTLGLAFFIGTMAWGLWTHLLLWVSVPLNPATVILGPVLLAACGRWGRLRETVWKRPSWPAWSLPAAALFLVYGALSWPLLGVDGDTREMYKASSIYHYGTVWNPDYLEPDRIHQGRRRPLLGTSIYVNLGHVSGQLGGRPLRLWMALLHIGALLALYDALRGRVGRTAAALGTALYAWVPAYWHDAGGAVTGYLDAPLSMLFLLAVVSELPLAVFCAAAAVLLKDDAMPFILGFALVRGWKAGLIPAALAVAWIATSSMLPLDSEYFPRGFLSPKPELIPFILRNTASEMVSGKHWAILWILCLVTFACRARSLDRRDLRLLLPAGVQLCAYFGVWMSLPFSLELVKANIKVQDMRLLMHLAPLVWFWAVWRSEPWLFPGSDPAPPPPEPGVAPGPA